MAKTDEKEYACMCVPLGANFYTAKRPASASDRDAKVMRMLVHRKDDMHFIDALIDAGKCTGTCSG